MKPALTLLVLGPWVAEYLLGSHTVVDLPLIIFLVPMYGGGALLIREVARRSGRGWPTMLLLGLAYGVTEAGLLDQSLFNPSYMEEDFNSITHIPWLGASATYLLAFVVGHTVWSICTPIALAEAWWPSRADRAWLGRFGLGVAAALYLSGSALIRSDHRDTEQFTAAAHQQVIAGLVAIALIAAAFLVGGRRRAIAPPGSTDGPDDRFDEHATRAITPPGSTGRPDDRFDEKATRPVAPPRSTGQPDDRFDEEAARAWSNGSNLDGEPDAPADGRSAPPPGRVALAAFLATAAFICVPGNWFGVVISLALVASAAVVVRRWSRRHGWGPAHPVALAAGALMTQAGVGFILHPWHEVTPALELASDVSFAAVAAAMGIFAVRHARSKRAEGGAPAGRAASPPGPARPGAGGGRDVSARPAP